MQKVVLPSDKPQDHACEKQNLFELKEDNPLQIARINESSKFVSHRAKMLGQFDSMKDSH